MSEFEHIPQGWQCPVCKQVYAPFIIKCENCRPKTRNEIREYYGFPPVDNIGSTTCGDCDHYDSEHEKCNFLQMDGIRDDESKCKSFIPKQRIEEKRMCNNCTHMVLKTDKFDTDAIYFSCDLTLAHLGEQDRYEVNTCDHFTNKFERFYKDFIGLNDRTGE